MILTEDYNRFKQANPTLEPQARDFANMAGTGPDVRPISTSTLTSNEQPLNLPPQPQDTTNYAGITTSIPTFDSLLGQTQQEQPAEKTASTLMERLLGTSSKLGQKGARQGQVEQSLGLPQFQTQLTDINNQLQSLQKEALAIPLQLQEQVQGRGVTAGGLQPIQTGQLRQNAIKSLTLSAIGQTLQGNIANAQAQANRAVDLEFQPLEAELNTLKLAYDMNKDILERQDKKRADALNLQIQERSRLLQEQKIDRKAVSDIGMKLAEFGVDSKTIQDVISSRNVDEAIVKAGSKLQDPKQIIQLENLRLDQTLTKQKIRREAYELQLLQEYGGLTPTQYAEKIKAEQKAINDAKDENEKNRLQGEAIDKKVLLLDSVLQSNAIDSVVGPSFASRGAKDIKGVIGRTVAGAGAGALAGAPFAGVGAIPGAIAGAVIAGGQGVKDYFTGSSDALIGQTEQFISKEFLDSLISTKAQGGTFGALTKAEQDALTNAATFIGNRRIFSGSGEDKEVVGYDMSEKDFKRELQTIQTLAKKAREKATGRSFDTTEQSVLDSVFEPVIPTSSYFQ